LGSYGNPDGIGIFYYNHNRKTGLYTKNKKFNNFKEGNEVLEKHLKKLIKWRILFRMCFLMYDNKKERW